MIANRWYFFHTGKKCDPGTVHGFKEIRYSQTIHLDFMMDAFPSAKIIVNYRRSIEEQSKSGFYSERDETVRTTVEYLETETSTMVNWGRSHPDQVYLFPLEDYSPSNFTRLFHWLGFPNCQAVQVAHANDATKGTYSSGIDGHDPDEFVSCTARVRRNQWER